MTFYASSSTACLRKKILNYFGEEAPGYCGKCGNCTASFETPDITDELRSLIGCVSEMEKLRGGFGRTTVRSVLAGSKSETLEAKGLTRLSAFGELSTYSSDFIYQLIDWALENRWLKAVGTQYPVLRIDTIPEDFFSSDRRVIAKMPQQKKTPAARRRTKEELQDRTLFEELRKLRKQIAAEQHVPPYIIFSDLTLTEIALHRPTSRKQLLACRGVTAAKMRNYGDRFIAVINLFISEEIKDLH